MNHIMLDLETLDTIPSAVVVSIGAVAFDPMTDELGEKFYVELDDLTYQQQRGRTISADTVRWWMEQEAMVRRVFTGVPSVPMSTSSEWFATRNIPLEDRLVRVRAHTVDALGMFNHYISNNGGSKALVWGNGADFDNIILGSLYQSMLGTKQSWSYSRNRCFRTMRSLTPDLPIERVGTYHDALDDAITQAKHLQKIMKELTKEVHP